MTVVDATRLHPAHLLPPISKSDAQRALVLLPDIALPPDDELPVDVRVVRDGMLSLSLSVARGSAPASAEARATAATGAGAEGRATGRAEIDCYDGGLPFRLLVGQAAVTPGAQVTFVGSARLGERPHEPLLSSLERALGPCGLVIERGTPWPVIVHAPARPVASAFHIDARESSQFATSLALAAARIVTSSIDVVLDGATASPGYLDLTLEWLRRAGHAVDVEGARVTIHSRTAAVSSPSIPGDWSSLAYLLLVAWRTGSTVGRIDLEAVHPDRAIVRILGDIGLSLEGGRVIGQPRSGVRASGAECPDLLPTLAALACVLPSPSTLTDVEILRAKESDRLLAIEHIVRAGGATARLDGETLTITPGAPLASFSISSAGDHRVAMSAATLAVLTGARLTLDDASVVGKSFPRFWHELAKVGVRIT